MAAHHFVTDRDNVSAEALREELRFFELPGKSIDLLLLVLRVGHDPLLPFANGLLLYRLVSTVCRVRATTRLGARLVLDVPKTSRLAGRSTLVRWCASATLALLHIRSGMPAHLQIALAAS